MIVTIQFRRGTSAEWAASNRVLEEGEPGYDSDLGRTKIGDGTTAWASLSFVSASFEIVTVLTGNEARPDAITVLWNSPTGIEPAHKATNDLWVP